MAILGPQDPELSVYVKSMCYDLDLLHFEFEPTTQPSSSFNLHPALDVMCLGFADLIKNFGWKNVAIFYDTKSSEWDL